MESLTSNLQNRENGGENSEVPLEGSSPSNPECEALHRIDDKATPTKQCCDLKRERTDIIEYKWFTGHVGGLVG